MTKIYSNVKAPEGEQQICVTCGFCCDGTLYIHATLQPGERGHLPEKIEAASRTGEGGDYFLQPCGYFAGSCTIYDRERADVCSTYRCSLLKLFAWGGISQEDALRTIREAAVMRDEVLSGYRRITGRDSVAGFRRMLVDLGEVMKDMKKSGAAAGVQAGDLEMLTVRCNILEALLIKAFMPAEEFEKYIMK